MNPTPCRTPSRDGGSRPSFRGALWAMAACGLVAAGAAYATARLSAAPATVANIDIRSVFEKLTQRSEMETELAAKRRSFEEEFRKRDADINARTKAAEALPEAERQATRDDLALAQLQLREWALMERATLEREEALQWHNLYRGVQQEAGRLAEAEGYDYVLVYDGPAPIEPAARGTQESPAQQVIGQVMRRRVLYAAAKDDVTERLIIRMNNAHAAGAKTAAKEPQ